MSLPKILLPTRVMYVYAVIIATLFVMGFFWFMFYAGVSLTRASVSNVMVQYNNNDTYTAFEYADTFMANIWGFFLVIMVLGLLYWAYIYSQRRGEVMY